MKMHNRYNGSRSKGKGTSRLARLVRYIALMERVGAMPTRQGFAAYSGSQHPEYATDLLTYAMHPDVRIVEYTGEKVINEQTKRPNKVLTLAENGVTMYQKMRDKGHV